MKIYGPGQTYTQDVDTLAFITQPLDILGKRKQRIAVAEGGVNLSQAEYELARLQIIQRVKLAYWAARGAQETRDSLKASLKNFQEIVDYHSREHSGCYGVVLSAERYEGSSSAYLSARRAAWVIR